MKFSVIVPVYNVADYLHDCVESILAQQGDFEVLLIDDGSTDGLCPSICDRYAAHFPETVRVIRQENSGVGAARNTGIRHAKGEYLLFVDSDDTIAPQTLAVLSDTLAHCPADIVYFAYDQVLPNGNRVPYPMRLPVQEKLSLSTHPQLLLGEPNIWTRLYRKSLFEEVLFPSRVWYEDIRTTEKLLARAETIVAIPDRLYGYSAREGSIMRNTNLGRNSEIIDALEDLIDWFRQEGLFERYKNELCWLTVEHVLLAASVRVARIDPKHPLLAEFSAYTRGKFPDYRQNPYRSTLTRSKRLALWLVEHRLFRTLKLLFSLKG